MKKAPLTKKTRPQNHPQTNGDGFNTGQLLAALMAFKRGDFSARLPEDWIGVQGKVADTFNTVIETNERMTRELERIVRVVGKEGRITQRASLGEVTNSWADAIRCINTLIGDLVQPTSEMARVIGAVAKGNLSQSMATEIEGRPLKGEFLHTAKTVNAMVGQLGAFASEVTRVAREVGTEGKLGGQAKGQRCRRNLERLDREREFHGLESHFAGA
jgi:methyl-accepting chemotaxis protein